MTVAYKRSVILIFFQFISDIKYRRLGIFTVCAYTVYNCVCSQDCSGFSTCSIYKTVLKHFTLVCGVQYGLQLYIKLQVCIRKYFQFVFTFCDICLNFNLQLSRNNTGTVVSNNTSQLGTLYSVYWLKDISYICWSL